MMKTCKKCGAEKEEALFPTDNACKDKRSPWCSDCKNNYARVYAKKTGHRHAKKWRKENPDKWFRHQMQQQGIDCTLQQYEDLLTTQGGVCAICHRPESDQRKARLSIDHNHKTGKVRGLLCGRCNLAIGKMEDNPDLLRNAVFYLEQHRC